MFSGEWVIYFVDDTTSTPGSGGDIWAGEGGRLYILRLGVYIGDAIIVCVHV